MNTLTLLAIGGKLGDIVWTLPLARQLHREGREVHYVIMPRYGAVSDLLVSQSYVSRVWMQPSWIETSDQCGAQPYKPPVEVYQTGYQEIKYLGYPSRPTSPLVLEAFKHAEVVPQLPLAPFIETCDIKDVPEFDVAYGFSGEHAGLKMICLDAMKKAFPKASFVDATGFSVVQAPAVIAKAKMFLGCRSLNYVLAMGVGQRCVTFEPNDGRRTDPIFSFPWGTERVISGLSLEHCAHAIGDWL